MQELRQAARMRHCGGTLLLDCCSISLTKHRRGGSVACVVSRLVLLLLVLVEASKLGLAQVDQPSLVQSP